MTISSVFAALVTVLVLACGFVVVVPRSPDGYVGLVTAGTFGAGVFYGRPTQRLLAHQWRRTALGSSMIRWTRPRSLARVLDRAGWNRQVRRPIRSFADLDPFRSDAAGPLVSHAVSLAIHLLATAALTVSAHPWWAMGCLGLGLVVHGWPCLLQIKVLVRLDELRAKARRRGRGGFLY